jgi:hypothetical protein
VVRLRKAHPCGGTDWQVYRLGADIGLRCLTCGRRVMLERAVLEKRIKVFVSRGNPAPNPLPVDEEGATSAVGNRAIGQSGSGPPGGSADV